MFEDFPYEILVVFFHLLPFKFQLYLSASCKHLRYIFLSIIKENRKSIQHLLIHGEKIGIDYLFHCTDHNFSLYEVLNYAPIDSFSKIFNDSLKQELLSLTDSQVLDIEFIFIKREIQKPLYDVFRKTHKNEFIEKFWRSHGFLGVIPLLNIDTIEKALYARSKNVTCNPKLEKNFSYTILKFIVDDKPENYKEFNLKKIPKTDLKTISRFVFLRGSSKVVADFFNYCRKYLKKDYTTLMISEISRRHDFYVVFDELIRMICDLTIEKSLKNDISPHVFEKLNNINGNENTLIKFFKLKYFEGINKILCNSMLKSVDETNRMIGRSYEIIDKKKLESLWDYYKRFFQTSHKLVTPNIVAFPLKYFRFSDKRYHYFYNSEFVTEKNKIDTLKNIIETSEYFNWDDVDKIMHISLKHCKIEKRLFGDKFHLIYNSVTFQTHPDIDEFDRRLNLNSN